MGTRKEQDSNASDHSNGKPLLVQECLSLFDNKSHLRKKGDFFKKKKRFPRGRELWNVHPGLWFIDLGLMTSESLGEKYVGFFF